MCLLFIYNGANDDNSDYSLVLISNRDEFYDRASQNMSFWSDRPDVLAGRDLEIADGGTWLAISPKFKKIGILLNIPGKSKENAKTRGKIAADYASIEHSTQQYVNNIQAYVKDCNEFVFVGVDFSSAPAIFSYSNVTGKLQAHTDTCVGFGNSLPETPLTKVVDGRAKLEEICCRLKKESSKKELMESLIALLKSEERHLPDTQLEARKPNLYKELSCNYVCIPQGRYGTRTHTIVLLTKEGCLHVTELTLQMPIDLEHPKWEKSEFKFNIPLSS